MQAMRNDTSFRKLFPNVSYAQCKAVWTSAMRLTGYNTAMVLRLAETYVKENKERDILAFFKLLTHGSDNQRLRKGSGRDNTERGLEASSGVNSVKHL